MSSLGHTRFALIGAGGLGGPVAYALAGAGAGGLTIVDDDEVELSNLQRQVQFTTACVGRAKTDALADELVRRGYRRGRIRSVDRRFDSDTAAEILADVDVVVDGSDNFATKFAVADAAATAGIPSVIAAVARYSGHVLSAAPGSACYRCLFEAPPAEDEAPPSCAEAGVLGAAVAVVAGAAARAALRLALGDRAEAGSITIFDDLRRPVAPRVVRFAPRAGCASCAAGASVHGRARGIAPEVHEVRR